MLPYFIMLMIPSTFALFNTHRLSLALWYTTYILFILFVGLRLEVGPDWFQYGYIHTTLANDSFWDVIVQAEPLSYLLFWISETSGFHVYLSNLVAATIMITGVFSFARRTVNPWLAVVTATPYFIFVMGMSGVRQTMAAGIVLFLLSRWERYNFFTRAAYILIAAMFHTSALVNNVFLIIKLNIPLRYKVVLGAAVLLLTLYLSFEVSVYADNIAQYQQRYIESDFVERSFGSVYHIGMITVPAVLGFLFRRRISHNIHSQSLLNFGLYASISMLVLNFFSTTVASRLTVYLYFVPMMVYPALISSTFRRGQLGGAFMVIFFHAMILFVWFNFANHAFAYINYKNVLFDE